MRGRGDGGGGGARVRAPVGVARGARPVLGVVTHPALEALRATLEGAAVTVLGSAPLAAPLVLEGRKLVAVNGGISSSAQNPEVWVCNSRLPPTRWGRERQRLAGLMLAQAAGRAVPLVIFLAKQAKGPDTTLAVLAAQGTHVAAWHALGATDRRHLESEAGARVGEVGGASLSAGLTATALALLAGAAEVRLEGFSWVAGYAYMPGKRLVNTRGHVHSDIDGLAMLEARYGAVLSHALEINPTIRGRARTALTGRNTARWRPPG